MARLRYRFVLCLSVITLSPVILTPGAAFGQFWHIEVVDPDGCDVKFTNGRSLALDRY